MHAVTLITIVCLALFGCSDQAKNEGEQQSPNTVEDGGAKQDSGGFDPLNPPDSGEIDLDGKPDAGGDDNDTVTGCTAGRELCGDGLDNDCDELADEHCACDDDAEQDCYDGPSAFAGVGLCSFGAQQCISTPEFNSWGVCEGARLPVIEVCNNALDDDCDGKSDEGCVCEVDETRACYGGSSATRGVGACEDGLLTCLEHGDEGKWSDDCAGEVTPATELCGNDVDEDCDGDLDNGCACEPDTSEPCYSGSDETRGVGACEDGTRACEVNEGVATWGSCEGDVTPSPEVCGNDIDEDCDDRLDNDCASLACPADVIVPAGDPLTLTAVGMGVTNYGFTISDGPEGGAATVVWSNLSSTSPTAQLTPIIVGEYTVRISAQNVNGDPLECSVRVTAQAHGLRIQLLWDGTGDVDLHLINEAATRWAIAPDGTYWENRNSTWGAVLDVDNIPGPGPENIRINSPEIGMTYTIGVHQFNNAIGRIATVDLFCGNTDTSPVRTWISRPLMGTVEQGGQCTGNDFWRVARVTFTSPSTCMVEEINDYITGAASCMAR